jgi:hypothetical protein
MGGGANTWVGSKSPRGHKRAPRGLIRTQRAHAWREGGGGICIRRDAHKNPQGHNKSPEALNKSLGRARMGRHACIGEGAYKSPRGHKRAPEDIKEHKGTYRIHGKHTRALAPCHI